MISPRCPANQESEGEARLACGSDYPSMNDADVAPGGNIGIADIVTGYRWCAVFVAVTGFTGAACRLGGVTVVP